MPFDCGAPWVKSQLESGSMMFQCLNELLASAANEIYWRKASPELKHGVITLLTCSFFIAFLSILQSCSFLPFKAMRECPREGRTYFDIVADSASSLPQPLQG